MDKIEKIRAEIERLYDEYKDKFKQHGDQYHLGLIDGLDMAERVLDTLSEEPDKSLEEAAQHREILTYPMPYDADVKKVMKVQEARVFHEIGFKAGAEWQKEQMLKDAVEGEAEELYNDGESQCVVSVGTYFKPGDEVYVIPKEGEK